MPNPRPSGPRMDSVCAVDFPAEVGSNSWSYDNGASPSLFVTDMRPAETQGPRILSPTSPRADVLVARPEALLENGAECASEPDSARNGNGCARIPTSALVLPR